MIRLYVDQEFELGQSVSLPADELHYYKSVRRERGQPELFNRKGQVARGRIEDKIFWIESLQMNPVPIWKASLAVGLPDRSVLRDIVLQASEFGIEELLFFSAQRSQAAEKRKEALSKLERLAVEAARQCGRAGPLRISWSSWQELLEKEADHKIFLDESAGAEEFGRGPAAAAPKSALMLVGPEGGWTEEERESLLNRGFTRLHLPTPVLRVPTACAAASFYAVQLLSRCSASHQ